MLYTYLRYDLGLLEAERCQAIYHYSDDVDEDLYKTCPVCEERPAIKEYINP